MGPSRAKREEGVREERSGGHGVSRGRTGVLTRGRGERGGGQGEEAAGAEFSKGARDGGGAGVRTEARVQGLVSPIL